MKHSKKVTAFVLSMLILCSTSLLSVSARSGDVLFEDGYGNQISKYNYVGIYVEEEKPVKRLGQKLTNEVFENCDISFIFEHPAYLTMGEDITDNTYYYNTYFQGATDVYVLMFDLDWKAIKVYDRVKDTTSIIPKNQLSMRQFEAGFVTYNYTKWKYTQPQNLTITVKGGITDERLVLRPRAFQFSYNVKLITKEEANKLLNKPTVKPAAPALSVSNKSNGIRAEWNKVTVAEKYAVYYKKTNATSWTRRETKNNYYPLTDLTAGTNYSVQVQSIGQGNVNGNYSTVKKLTYVPQIKPSLTLSNKSNGVRAEWNRISNATGYVVYFRKNTDSKWNSITTANNYYPLLNIEAGTKYAVQVQPVFGSAKGLYSNVSRLVYVPQIKPSLTLSNKSNGVRAEWNRISNATGYVVYFRKDTDSKWDNITTSNNYYPFLNFEAGTKYAVQVQTVFSSTKGLYSSVQRIIYSPTK